MRRESTNAKEITLQTQWTTPLCQRVVIVVSAVVMAWTPSSSASRSGQFGRAAVALASVHPAQDVATFLDLHVSARYGCECAYQTMISRTPHG
jgi:hypothetical protein